MCILQTTSLSQNNVVYNLVKHFKNKCFHNMAYWTQTVHEVFGDYFQQNVVSLVIFIAIKTKRDLERIIRTKKHVHILKIGFIFIKVHFQLTNMYTPKKKINDIVISKIYLKKYY